jgi:hypothetical protein
MNWRASIFELPSRGEQVEIAGVNVADCALGPQSDHVCENALLEVCPRCWFSRFYCFLPPLFDAHSHEWSIERGERPSVVWMGITCECTASVGRMDNVGASAWCISTHDGDSSWVNGYAIFSSNPSCVMDWSVVTPEVAKTCVRRREWGFCERGPALWCAQCAPGSHDKPGSFLKVCPVVSRGNVH